MKRINVGEVNDGTLYAIIIGEIVYPLAELDLEFQKADVEIGYDTGVYPGLTIEELPRYLCQKAAEQLA